MTTEQYSIGYDEGYQAGWNAAMDAKPAQQEPVAIALNTGTKQGVKWLKNVEHGESLYTTPQQKLVPYEPSIDMQEHGSIASGYDLSQARAKKVYQAMIDMHDVMMEREPTDEWFRLQAGYPEQPAQRTWVGLTRDEFRDFASTLEYGTGGLIRAIEAKLKEKNA